MKEVMTDKGQSGGAERMLRVDEETAGKASAEGMADHEIEAQRYGDDIDPDAEQEAKKHEDNTDEERGVASEVEEEGRFTEGESVEDHTQDSKVSTTTNEAQSDESTTAEIVAGETNEAKSDAAIARGMTGDGHNMLTKNTFETSDNGESTTKDDLSNALGETEDNAQTRRTTADLNSNQVVLVTSTALAFILTLSWPQILSQKTCRRQTSPQLEKFSIRRAM